MHHSAIIAKAIDESPLNRGLRGADWVRDTSNIPFVEGKDVILFDRDSDGIYEIHVLLIARGRAAVDCIQRAFAMMFREKGTAVIFGMVPDFRRDVKIMVRLCGMKFLHKLNHRGDDVELFELTREQWENSQ